MTADRDVLSDRDGRRHFDASIPLELREEITAANVERDRLRAERDGLDEQCRGFARAAEETGRELAALRAENERLRETLKALGPAFPSHHIDGEKGGRWIEYGDGDGYWDDGDVHTEDCPACALGRRIDEALGSPLTADENLLPEEGNHGH